MGDSWLNEAERSLQPGFIKRLMMLAFLLPPLLVLESDREDGRPDRKVRPPATAMIEATPLPIPANKVGLGGLWELRSSERRFGGLSGLALDKGGFLAVTDSGVIVRWPGPGGLASFQDLPDGPGPPQWKISRDAEAISRDVAGRGWWVAFEQTHGIWLFDHKLERAVGRRDVRLRTWWRNWGVEAALSLRDGLLLLPEGGAEAILLRNGREERKPLEVDGAISDAAILGGPAPSIVAAVRKVRPWGISNSLGTLKTGDRLTVREWGTLPLGRRDNVEGIALERRPDGRDRLWFVTDNDFDRRTLLGWVDVTHEASASARASGNR
jgi:hypothetical protein